MATAVRARGLRVLREEPLCAETRLAQQRGLLTGNDHFYVRSNFPDPAGWPGLQVAGAVERPLHLGLADLDRFAARDLVVTMECAGNGRAFLDPAVPGEPWALGAVSTAHWAGVPLAAVLEEARLPEGVVEVAFEGADGFARSLPVDVAQHSDTMLAMAMNGSPLPRAHGGPLRLLVPRWYGMASVKWLDRVVALREPFRGHFQVEKYVIDGKPVREMRVRAVIAEPAEGSIVAGGRVRLAGYAWSGAGEIAAVEVSDDCGRTWLQAELIGSAQPYGWTRWEATWRPRGAGPAELLARALDSAGNLQPLQPVWNQLGYCNHAAVPHRLSVV